MNISDDKAVKVGTKMFWWGITLLILLAIFKFADKAISREIRVYRESHAPKGFIEGDLWIARGSTVKKPGIKTKTRRREMAGGKDVEIVTPCEVMYPYITSLEPGENVQIRHIDFGPDFPTRNRCSYGANGASIPIYGEPGKVTRPRFRHDLPFPDLPPGVMVFIIQDARGNIVAHDYIREAGGIIYFNNPLTEKAEVHLQYNYMQAFLTDPAANEQIGWDGSTATFHATRFRSEPPTMEVENH